MININERGLQTGVNILVIDGQGGKLGRQLIEVISGKYPDVRITAVGTNSIATEAMLKGGAAAAATGENAAAVCSRTADIIIGPVGIVIADSMLGEITPAMAVAVGQSTAYKILIPTGRCNNFVAGVGGVTLGALVSDAVAKIGQLISSDREC